MHRGIKLQLLHFLCTMRDDGMIPCMCKGDVCVHAGVCSPAVLFSYGCMHVCTCMCTAHAGVTELNPELPVLGQRSLWCFQCKQWAQIHASEFPIVGVEGEEEGWWWWTNRTHPRVPLQLAQKLDAITNNASHLSKGMSGETHLHSDGRKDKRE